MPVRPDAQPESQAAPEQLIWPVVRLVLSFLAIARSSPMLKLVTCLLVDAIGFGSFLLPGLGETFDIAWAPLQAAFLQYMFGSIRMTAIGFFEELFPGTDFVPSATLGWMAENVDASAMEGLRSFTGVARRSQPRRA